MTGIAALVEAPVDWSEALSDRLKDLPKVKFARDPTNYPQLEEQFFDPGLLIEGFGTPPKGYRLFWDRFLDEIHDLLCSDDKYVEERKQLLNEYKIGQAALVDGITAIIAPHLGSNRPYLAALVAMTLTVVGKIGVNAWCAIDSERRETKGLPDQTSVRRPRREPTDITLGVSESHPGGAMSINTTSGEGLTILVVDDDRTTADVFSESLDRDQVFTLIEVSTADEAVKVLARPYTRQAPLPDLVVINAELFAAHTAIFKTALMRANIPPMRTALVGGSVSSDSYSSYVLPTPIEKKDVVALIDQLYRDIARTASSKSHARVFLSHSSGDKGRVRELYERLSSDGVECWFDEADLLGGQDWDYEISRAIQDSKIFLACLSNHSVTKTGYVQTELKKALDVADRQPEGAVFILPVRLEECRVPDRLSKWHRIDLFLDGGYGRLLKSLRAALQDRSG